MLAQRLDVGEQPGGGVGGERRQVLVRQRPAATAPALVEIDDAPHVGIEVPSIAAGHRGARPAVQEERGAAVAGCRTPPSRSRCRRRRAASRWRAARSRETPSDRTAFAPGHRANAMLSRVPRQESSTATAAAPAARSSTSARPAKRWNPGCRAAAVVDPMSQLSSAAWIDPDQAGLPAGGRATAMAEQVGIGERCSGRRSRRRRRRRPAAAGPARRAGRGRGAAVGDGRRPGQRGLDLVAHRRRHLVAAAADRRAQQHARSRRPGAPRRGHRRPGRAAPRRRRPRGGRHARPPITPAAGSPPRIGTQSATSTARPRPAAGGDDPVARRHGVSVVPIAPGARRRPPARTCRAPGASRRCRRRGRPGRRGQPGAVRATAPRVVADEAARG